ncbi:unnamed protein product [Moneuplotes crassus]|uniref:Uncharacterized protein n=1 Tax=Euplotes crassus TaxID=5936 RepID=A0AAD1UMJ2_EUPCR|nr:unnamed protein product [Moneuplotes crassus]
MNTRETIFSKYQFCSFKPNSTLEDKRFIAKLSLLHNQTQDIETLPSCKDGIKQLSSFVDKRIEGGALKSNLTLMGNPSNVDHEFVLKDLSSQTKRERKHPKVLLPLKNKREIKAFSVESKLRVKNSRKIRALSQGQSLWDDRYTNYPKSISQNPSFKQRTLDTSEPLPPSIRNFEPTLLAMNGYSTLRKNLLRGDALKRDFFENETLGNQKQFSSARKPAPCQRRDIKNHLTKKRFDFIKPHNISKKFDVKNLPLTIRKPCFGNIPSYDTRKCTPKQSQKNSSQNESNSFLDKLEESLNQRQAEYELPRFREDKKRKGSRESEHAIPESSDLCYLTFYPLTHKARVGQ